MIKLEERKDKSEKAKLLLCFALSCLLFLGSFTHSFIQYEVGSSHSQAFVEDTSSENGHSHSHSHDVNFDSFEDNQRHLHKHNPLDHSHDLPVILVELPKTTLEYGLLHLTQAAQCMNSLDCSSLERPPKQAFLINLS